MKALSILTAGALLLAIGCSADQQQNAKDAAGDAAGQAKSAMEETASQAADQAGEMATEAAEKVTETASGMASEAAESVKEMVATHLGQEITLVGTMGCGHCTFHKGESCAAAMQTADGTVFIMDNVAEEDELFQKRLEGGQVKVVGVVSQQEGTNHLEVSSSEIL